MIREFLTYIVFAIFAFGWMDVGFGPQDGSPRLYFIDNVDPNTFEALFSRIDLNKTGFQHG